MKYLLILILFLSLSSCKKNTMESDADIINSSNGQATLKFTSPTDASYYTQPSITLSGQAFHRSGISKIEVAGNDGIYQLSSGKESFSISLSLVKGLNTFTAKMTSTTGYIIYSTPLSIYFLWEKINDLPIALSGHQMVISGNSAIILGGETLISPFVSAKRYIYSFPSNSFSESGDINKRYNGMAVLHNSKIYLAGGLKGKDTPAFYETETYSSITGNIESSISAGSNWRDGTDITPCNGKYYIVGGRYDIRYSDKIFEFTPETATFNQVALLPTGLKNHKSVCYNNKIYTFGGIYSNINADDRYSPELYIFNTSDNFVSTSSVKPLSARAGMGLALMGSKVYIMGGEGGNSSIPYYLDTIEVFDLSNMTTISENKLPLPLGYFQTTVYNNEIYIFGGKNEYAVPIQTAVYKYKPN